LLFTSELRLLLVGCFREIFYSIFAKDMKSACPNITDPDRCNCNGNGRNGNGRNGKECNGNGSTATGAIATVRARLQR
jgi:hypothetical protein